MHNIELEIHPITGYKAKPIGKLNFTLPAEWNELTNNQLLAIAPLYFQELSETEFKLQALACFIDRKILAYLDAEYIMHLFPCIEFLKGKIELTEQKFSGVYNNLVGPAKSFENMNVAEYLSADNYFRQFLRTNDQNALEDFVACLFRPIDRKSSSDSDRRKKYSALGTALYIKEIRNFKPAFLYAQVLWFAACKSELSKYYPNIFPEPEEGEASKSAGEEANWASILFRISKTNVFGNFGNLTENEYIHNVFSYLEQEFVEYEQSTRNTNHTEPS